MKSKLIYPFLFALTAVFVLQFFIVGSPTVVTALPPRPTATAVPAQNPKIKGAQIILQIEGELSSEIWTIVQWQDAQNAWHDVSGWQGTLDADNQKTWWVGEEHLGAGPFRWMVHGDNFTELSDDFFLPDHASEKLVVIVTLE